MDFQSPEEARLTLLLFITMMIAAAFIACSAEAYIPSSQFVFSRVAAQHGKGAYLIEDEVSFQQGNDTATMKENWVVVDGGEMRLISQGSGGHLFRIMKKGRIFWLDESGSERSEEVPDGYIMRFLLTRNPNEEKRIFVNWHVLPPDVFREKRLPKEVKDIEVTSENFVRWGRTGGAVTYAYGKPSPPSGEGLPGLWIEQDQFFIRKTRDPKGGEAQFNDYGSYSKGLSFPKSSQVTFDNHVVSIKTLRVSSIELGSELRRQFEMSWLRGRPDAQTTWPKGPLEPIIREFYSRFR